MTPFLGIEPRVKFWFCFWLVMLVAVGMGCLPAIVTVGKETGPKLSVTSLAPDQHFWRFGGFIVGVPDFTGNPRWTVQEIKSENLTGPGDRSQSRWRSDVRCLPERPIGDSDYKNNPLSLDDKAHPQGVARGHLVCAADQAQSQDATDDTHHMSNCGPEDQALNAQGWERSEQRGRDLRLLADKLKIKARVFETNVLLYVLEKPGDLTTHAWVGTFNGIGKDCVWYPSHWAKSYYVVWGNRKWIETYVFENSATVAHDDIALHLTSVNVVEFESNLNLWPGIDDEDELEASEDKPPTLEALEAEAAK